MVNQYAFPRRSVGTRQLESLCLDWFRGSGWDLLYGPDIAPDKVNGVAREGALGYGTDPQRDDYAQVMLKHDLEVAFTHINPHLPHECFDQVALNTEVSL